MAVSDGARVHYASTANCTEIYEQFGLGIDIQTIIIFRDQMVYTIHR